MSLLTYILFNSLNFTISIKIDCRNINIQLCDEVINLHKYCIDIECGEILLN